jgi:hypothetical protein
VTTTPASAPGGSRSPRGAEAAFAPLDPANTKAPEIKGEPQVGATLTADPGAWTGDPSLGYQWQRCDPACGNLAGARGATHEPTEADKGHRLRVAVLAGNWVSSVSQAFSAPTGAIAARPETRREDGEGPRSRGGPAGAPLRLTRVKMSPRRFAVAHRRLPKGTKLDGSRVSWKLSRAATARLTFQRHTRRGWVRVGTISRASKAGTGELRFRGRFGKRLLKPQRYRLVVTATQGGERTPARRLGFRVVRG